MNEAKASVELVSLNHTDNEVCAYVNLTYSDGKIERKRIAAKTEAAVKRKIKMLENETNEILPRPKQKREDISPMLVSPLKAAKMLGLKKKHIEALMNAKLIPYMIIDGKTYVYSGELQTFLKNCSYTNINEILKKGDQNGDEQIYNHQ